MRRRLRSHRPADPSNPRRTHKPPESSEEGVQFCVFMIGICYTYFLLLSLVELATPAILEMAFSGGIGFLGLKVQGLCMQLYGLFVLVSIFGLGYTLYLSYLVWIWCGGEAMGFHMIWVMSFFCCDLEELCGRVYRVITA
jgi:hypothetical protein